MDKDRITIIGGGFAGAEAAWAAANSGLQVVLYEMRPTKMTSVHRSGDIAEIVCSNSFKSNLLTNASGIMKQEMRLLGSLTMEVAEKYRVPAGEALAVDREKFAHEMTLRIVSHPLITVIREEIQFLPVDRPLIVATGPLTSESLAQSLQSTLGGESLSFYDAVAPTVTLDSLDLSKVFRASRRGRTSGLSIQDGSDEPEDYLNCPFTREEYICFREALVAAELAPVHNPDDEKIRFFEMCLPIEEIASRGERTMSYGPLKPVGLTDPRTDKRPWAVVQLRQENREGTLWGLVGFQTRLKWSEQKRVFQMIPGLQNAEFVRYGVMHRNTYVNSPHILDMTLQVKETPGLYLAGQMTGVEGYLESAAMGILAGINAGRELLGKAAVVPPATTVIGSLCRYLVETDPTRFSPMNANFGVVPELESPERDKREKARKKGVRALEAMGIFRNQLL